MAKKQAFNNLALIDRRWSTSVTLSFLRKCIARICSKQKKIQARHIREAEKQ